MLSTTSNSLSNEMTTKRCNGARAQSICFPAYTKVNHSTSGLSPSMQHPKFVGIRNRWLIDPCSLRSLILWKCPLHLISFKFWILYHISFCFEKEILLRISNNQTAIQIIWFFTCLNEYKFSLILVILSSLLLTSTSTSLPSISLRHKRNLFLVRIESWRYLLISSSQFWLIAYVTLKYSQYMLDVTVDFLCPGFYLIECKDNIATVK